MKILLLEDNQTDAELTLRALKKNLPDCEVEHATTLQKGREFLSEKEYFDIALLDMQLPDGNGMDLLMEIRQKKLDMAVAMLTGSGDEEVAVAALKAGADDYTVKQPGYTAKVPQTVELALENHRKYNERVSGAIHVLYIEHNAADVIFTLDFDLNYTYISPAIYSMLGFAPEEVVGRKISEILTPASFKKAAEIFQKVLPQLQSSNVSPEPKVIELETFKNDGSTIWVEVKASILTDNAVKFTKEGTVTFGCRVKNKTLYGFVEDTGVGIDASMQKTVFEHFTQADSRNTRGYEGSGLGLSIAKELVELLGGEISLESEKGKGTRAQFSVPV